MLAADRLAQIQGLYEDQLRAVRVLDLDGETLRLVLYLVDGTNLRVTEKWRGRVLERYAYYWLEANDVLKIGWDNAPHHTKISTHPHHKHIGQQSVLAESTEHSLEQVLEWIIQSHNLSDTH